MPLIGPPISYTNLDGELRLSEMITMELYSLLRDSASLRNTPYLTYVGSINGSGSDTLRVKLAGLGKTVMISTAEGGTITPSALLVNHADVIVSRQALCYTITDLSNISQFGEDVDPFVIANSMAAAYEGRFMAMVTAAGASFTNVVGAIGTTMSVDDFLDGIYQLERADSEIGNNGPFVLCCASKALTELQSSLRSEAANSLSLMQSAHDLQKAKGQGYSGSLIGVEIFKTSHISDNGASHYDNLMWAVGGIGYADGSPGALVGASAQLQAGPVTVEFSRNSQDATTVVTGGAYVGVSILEDARGVIIKSTA